MTYTIENGFVFDENGNYEILRIGSGIDFANNIEYRWIKDADNIINGSVNDATIDFCNADTFTFTSCLTINWPTSNSLEEGKYMLEISITDGTNNTITYSNSNLTDRIYVSSFVDRTPPRVALNSLTASYDDSGNITTKKRDNAATVDWSGNAWFKGKVTSGTEKLATETYVNKKISGINFQ
jgi:hypothetical protein